MKESLCDRALAELNLDAAKEAAINERIILDVCWEAANAPPKRMPRYKRDPVENRLDRGHYSLAEHGARALLLDEYVGTGKPLPLKLAVVYRMACALRPSEKAAVRFVLAEEFEKTDQGYVHPGIDKELAGGDRRRNFPARTRIAILARDRHECVYCGDRQGPFEIDHVIPWSRGGSDEEANLATACRACNQDKSDRTPDEWKSGC